MIGDLAIGSQVGRYQILGPLGRGGMGEVYAAYHPDLERRIALKIVEESGPDSAERRARLLREARAIARLSHPNVVSVHDAGTVGDRVYIAMELVEGETVDAWQRAAPRTWREVVDVFVAAGRGLAAAHAADIVHRDFKPQNVMVGKDGGVRVMDFGLARLVNDDLPGGAERERADHGGTSRSATVTKTGALLGTPAYMAPEQFRGGATDARADQFSYCVALHEALHGLRPRLAHLEEDLPAALSPPVVSADRRSRVPAWLRAAVLRGLRQDPAQRFASMNQLLVVLERGRTRRRRRVLAAAASLISALVIFGGWRVAHQPRFECKVPADRLAAAWPLASGGARRDQLERALLASGGDDAPAVWRQLASTLDDHVGKWTVLYQEACEATHLRGEQSPEVLDLRMRCLANNLDEVRALTDVLIKADARAISQAVGATGGLTPTTVCSDVALLRSKVPLPRDEPTRRKIEGLQRAVNDARALRDVGNVQSALEQTRALQPEVEAVRHPPLMAALLMLIGTIRVDLGDFAQAETMVKNAFVAAEAGNDDAARAEAASLLVTAVGMQGRLTESDLWVRDANAILDRLGPGHGRTRSWVLNNQGGIFFLHGDFERARLALEQAVALKEEGLGPRHPDVAITLFSLGVAYKGLGKLERALAAEDRALAIWNDPGSLFAAKASSNRGEILTALGRHREAEEAFQSALRVFERETDPDDVEVSHPLTGLAEAKLATGDARGAIPLFERALRIREEKEKIAILVADTRFGLARALGQAQGDAVRASKLAQSARGAYDDGRHAGKLAEIDAWLAGDRAGNPGPGRASQFNADGGTTGGGPSKSRRVQIVK
jgi:tetratricopeptide (TPR) repeat protein